jgi:hypothetical protein
MKLQTEDFRKVFKIIDLVENHAGLLSSQFVKLTCNQGSIQMALAGLCIAESRLKTPEAVEIWNFYLDRRVLAAFLDTTRAQTIDVTLQKGSLTLLAGRQKANFTAMDEVSGYSIWKPKPGTLRSLKLSDEMRQELGVLAEYAPITAAADHLSAVYLVEKYGIIATDSFVIAACLDPGISHTFPLPVVLSKLAAGNKVTSLDLDKTGAGIRFPEGHVFQPISARCQKEYPLRKIQDALKVHQTVKPILKINAGKLNDSIEHLQKFIFGSDVDVLLQLQAGQREGNLLMLLDLVRGKTQIASAGELVTKGLDLKWPVAKIAPWVSYVAKLDKEGTILCAFDPQSHCNILQMAHGKRRYILVVAENLP